MYLSAFGTTINHAVVQVAALVWGLRSVKRSSTFTESPSLLILRAQGEYFHHIIAG
jgi:hypothetical protein